MIQRYKNSQGKMIKSNKGSWVKFKDIPVKNTDDKKKTKIVKNKNSKNKLLSPACLRAIFKNFPVTMKGFENRVIIKKDFLYYLNGDTEIGIKDCGFKDGIFELVGDILIERKTIEEDDFYDFKNIEKIKAKEIIELKYKDYESISKFIDKNVVNPALREISIRDNAICGTDSRILLKIDKKTKNKIDIIIPNLCFLFKKTKENIKIEVTGDNKVKMIQGNLIIIKNIVELNFPNYEQIFPKQTKNYLEFSRDGMREIIKEVKKFKTFVKMRIDLKKEKVISKCDDILFEREIKISSNTKDYDYINFLIKSFEKIMNVYDLPEKIRMEFNNIDGPYSIEYQDKKILIASMRQD